MAREESMTRGVADDPNALIFKAGLVGAEDPAAGLALYDHAVRGLGAHPPGAILARRAELWQQLLRR